MDTQELAAEDLYLSSSSDVPTRSSRRRVWWCRDARKLAAQRKAASAAQCTAARAS
jgi:hypothetical protein